MSKHDTIKELTNILAKALRHKIGAIVNSNEIYAQKYARDADILLKEAEKISLRENWNSFDKLEIRKMLQKKLRRELESKDFLDEKKFDYMEKEIESTLKMLGLAD